MANSQCLPCYTNSFLKEDCQPIGNGGQIFTDNRPTQELLSIQEQNQTNNNIIRQQMINGGNTTIKKNRCTSMERTKCHYMNVPEKCDSCK